MAGFVYDTGMLLALERGAAGAWKLHQQALGGAAVPVVPVMVLAQAWRGGPQPNLSRALSGCRSIDVTEPLARAAGALCGRTGTADVVDALVAIVGTQLAAAVVTSDAADLRLLVDALDRELPLVLV